VQAAGEGALEVKVASTGGGCRRCLRRDQRLRPVGEKASELQLRTGGGQGLRSSSTSTRRIGPRGAHRGIVLVVSCNLGNGEIAAHEGAGKSVAGDG
jgi:hypothetical protein